MKDETGKDIPIVDMKRNKAPLDKVWIAVTVDALGREGFVTLGDPLNHLQAQYIMMTGDFDDLFEMLKAAKEASVLCKQYGYTIKVIELVRHKVLAELK